MSNGDDGDRPITAAEAADLRTALADIQQGQEDLREAITAGERTKARADIDDAKEDLNELAKRLGISRTALDESITAAKKAERKEELREVVAELIAETNPPDPPAVVEPPVVEPPVSGDPPVVEPPVVEPPVPPVEDTEPVRPHWGDRSVGELLKG